jgi:ATP-dependent HslUV protease ATP-binding subunit HslU
MSTEDNTPLNVGGMDSFGVGSGTSLSPKEIVQELDRFVIGQTKAKEYVANALRNRWRRMQIKEPMRSEVEPKNILMIGPTGVGKTEIARRLAKITDSPFIKVEATKFTEVGYAGRDVEQIIRDLVESTIAKIKMSMRQDLKSEIMASAEEQVLDLISGEGASPETRKKYLEELRAGKLDEKMVSVTVMQPIEIQGAQVPDLLSKLAGKKRRKTMTVAAALKFFQSEEMDKEMDDEHLPQRAIELVESCGIVFIDEIDKICEEPDRYQKGSVSREGVQRDLLPLIEGTEVSTKHGFVKTNHILFIASGAFQIAKKEDLIPELQGRFPVVVQMQSLKKEDFVAILSQKESSLTHQHQALLGTDGIELEFTPDGIEMMAEAAVEANRNEEDIGARRLHGLLENIMHHVGFNADVYNGKVVINREFVLKYYTPKPNKHQQYIL